MPDSNKLRAIALKVVNNANLNHDEKFGSVIAILMIISVVLTCIRILQECNKNKLPENCSMSDKCAVYGEEIRTFSRQAGWFTRARIKRILRKELSKEDYNKYALPLVSSILHTGVNLTDDEIQTLVESSHV